MCKEWTNKEIDFLRNNYLSMTDEELGIKLNRTESSINSKRTKLQLLKGKKRDCVDKEELDKIINDYKLGMDIKAISDKYNRYEWTVRSHLKKSNVFIYENKRWSEEEVNILKLIYPEGSWEEILKVIPNHVKAVITSKASELKISKINYKWNKEETNLLIKAYNDGIKRKEISEKIFNNKISVTEISRKVTLLGIANDLSIKEWEVEYLTENYGKITVDEIGKVINRKRGSIIAMAYKLGLSSDLKNCLGEIWTKEEDDFIKENYLELTDLEMVSYLEKRTWRAIKWRRSNLGIERPSNNSYGIGCINEDGEVFNSQAEMKTYEFIKSFNVLKYIKNIGTNHKKKGKYVFKLDETFKYGTFYPDFVVECVYVNEKKMSLLKPIIIEFYGMANFQRKDNNPIILNYNKKVLEKERFYKSKEDINYIGIFPEDIKNNFEGLRKKLSSFFKLNLNIDINNTYNDEKLIINIIGNNNVA